MRRKVCQVKPDFVLDPKYSKSILTPERLSLARHYINRDLVLNVGPVYLLVETTNVCDLSCVICPRREMKRKVGFMDFGLFKKIIDQAEKSVEFIYLHFFGEPLLHKDIEGYIDYASGRGITIAFSTNASFLAGENITKVMDSKLDLLIISIDATSPEPFAKIRVGGDFEAITQNIEAFLKEHQRRASKLNVVLQMINISKNQDEITKFRKRWSRYPGAILKLKDLHDYANQLQDITCLRYGNGAIPDSTGAVCKENWRGIVIGWDGKVVPCCNDFDYKYILGDLNKQTLLDVWNGEKMMALRSQQNEGYQKNNELCKRCVVPSEQYLPAMSLFSSFSASLRELRDYAMEGLYEPEILPEYENQWTQRSFTIFVQDRCGKVDFQFENTNPIADKIILKVSRYEEVLEDIVFNKNERKIVLFETPKEWKGRLLRYDFEVSETWIPDKIYHSGDNRKLGLNIIDIRN